jgi:hypothetical protein
MTWKRVEGGAIDPQIEEGLAAVVADPLWFLARQWQVGEFRGEDAATPIMIEADVTSAPVTKYWTEDSAGKRTTVPRTQFGAPLEALVEREPVTGGPAAVELNLEAGAALLRRLAQAGAAATLLRDMQRTYAPAPVRDDELDPVGHARLKLLARFTLDAAKLQAAIAAAGNDPAKLPLIAALPDATKNRIVPAIRTWQAQDVALFSEIAPGAPSAWSGRRLEYSFGVTAVAPDGGVIELEAPEYPGGRLDWHHFDVTSFPKPKPTKAPKGTPVPATALPKTIRVLATPLQFAGMPAARWWEFEDGDAYFGDVGGGPEDLARSVIAAYSTVAGDDWFSVPCTLPIGSIAQVTQVRVLDDFGGRVTVPAAAVIDAGVAAERPWRFFELFGDPTIGRGDAPLVFLPPVVDTVEQGRPLEAVEFRRDEMANVAWAIERRVESTAGRAVDREAGPRPEPLPPPEDGAWRYQLATDVPDNWVPLVPVKITGARPDIVLRRGRLAAEADAHDARGRILEPEHAFVVCEEEIDSGGLRVTRRYQLTRAGDGSVHVWVGRRKGPSSGPMRRTPLRFDSLTYAPAPGAGTSAPSP